MASEANVVLGSFTETTEIAIGINDISQAWLGANLLWEKSGSGGITGTWQPFVADGIFMVAYTPASTVQLDTFSMIHDNNSPVYNYVVAVYTAARSKVFSQTGTSGVSIVVGDDYDGTTSYTHTMNFGGSGPTLTGGTTYYLGLGERYATYRTLASSDDDAGAGASCKGWSLTNTTSQAFTSTSSTLYLKVTTV